MNSRSQLNLLTVKTWLRLGLFLSVLKMEYIKILLSVIGKMIPEQTFLNKTLITILIYFSFYVYYGIINLIEFYYLQKL